ncbi:MAG: hypothetical protein ACFB10_08170 [Salibacteraceae bacterium]
MSDTKYIKLLWEFRGPGAHQTATHHEIHLKDFLKKQPLDPGTTGVEQVDEHYSVAFLIIQQPDLPLVKNSLRPHRAFLVDAPA